MLNRVFNFVHAFLEKLVRALLNTRLYWTELGRLYKIIKYYIWISSKIRNTSMIVTISNVIFSTKYRACTHYEGILPIVTCELYFTMKKSKKKSCQCLNLNSQSFYNFVYLIIFFKPMVRYFFVHVV